MKENVHSEFGSNYPSIFDGNGLRDGCLVKKNINEVFSTQS